MSSHNWNLTILTLNVIIIFTSLLMIVSNPEEITELGIGFTVLALLINFMLFGFKYIDESNDESQAKQQESSPPPPNVISEEVDEQGRLHCLDSYARAFSDGRKDYYVHGVQFSKNMFNDIFIKKSYTPKKILDMRNAEQKSAVIKCIGFDYLINDLEDYEVIDELHTVSKVNGNPLTYQVIDYMMTINNKVRIVKLQDHTTGKIACLTVPIIPKTHTCMGAIAWTFNMDIWDYNPEVET